MARRYYSSTAVRTTLSAPITDVATSLVVGDATGYPTVPFTIIVDADTISEEVMTVTSKASTTFTVTRAVDGTSAIAHSAGGTVQHGVSARDFDEPNSHIDTAAAVHGLSGSVVGTTDTQTLTNKTLTGPVVTAGFKEGWNVSATAATGTVNMDVVTAAQWFYTTDASADFTLNIRGNSGTTLSSLLSVGQSVTVTFSWNCGATEYRPSVIQIDGSTVTAKWPGGVTPTAGSASSVNLWQFTIIKTAATPTYTVLGNYNTFA